MSDWTRVEVSLPAKGKPVAVRLCDGTVTAGMLREYLRCLKPWLILGHGLEDHVTHWQPLPTWDPRAHADGARDLEPL